MTEILEPGVLETPEPTRKIRARPSDIIIFAIILAVCIGLGGFIYSKVVLKRDVQNAQIVASKTVAAIEKRDGGAARALGDKDFQVKNSADDLTKLFKAKEIATLKTPTLSRTIAFTSENGRTVYFVYTYTALKVPFYVRVGVHNADNQWKLVSITGNLDESKLVF